MDRKEFEFKLYAVTCPQMSGVERILWRSRHHDKRWAIRIAMEYYQRELIHVHDWDKLMKVWKDEFLPEGFRVAQFKVHIVQEVK